MIKMIELLLLVFSILAINVVNGLHPATYAPQTAAFPYGFGGMIIAGKSNIIDCAFRCSQAFISSRSCTAFWVGGQWCNIAMCGKQCFVPAVRAVAKNHTVYARTDAIKKGQIAMIAGGDLTGSSISNVEVFSPDGGCQYSLKSLPQPLSGLSLDVVWNQIMACSGYNSVTNQNNPLCWIYDIGQNTWNQQTISLTKTNPYNPSLVFVNNIYFINDVAPEKVQNYWGTINSPWGPAPPVAIGDGACGVVWKANFIIFGGKLGGKTVQLFNVSTGTWSAKAPMNFARNYFACAILPPKDKILVLSTVPGVNETTAELYDPQADTWFSTGSTQYARAGAALQVLGQRVFVIGGGWTPSPTSLSATVEEYDVASGTWSLSKATLLSSRRNFGVVSVPAVVFDNLPQGCVGV